MELLGRHLPLGWVLVADWFELLWRDLNAVGWLRKLHENVLLVGHLRGVLGECHCLRLLEDHRLWMSLSLSHLSELLLTYIHPELVWMWTEVG